MNKQRLLELAGINESRDGVVTSGELKAKLANLPDNTPLMLTLGGGYDVMGAPVVSVTVEKDGELWIEIETQQ